MAVGVLRHHIDGVTDVGIAQRIGAASRPGHIHPVTLPLVADHPEPIGIRTACSMPSEPGSLRAVPLIVTDPVGGSLTLVTAAVAALTTLSAVP